jgi:hypothetical protein
MTPLDVSQNRAEGYEASRNWQHLNENLHRRPGGLLPLLTQPSHAALPVEPTSHAPSRSRPRPGTSSPSSSGGSDGERPRKKQKSESSYSEDPTSPKTPTTPPDHPSPKTPPPPDAPAPGVVPSRGNTFGRPPRRR